MESFRKNINNRGGALVAVFLFVFFSIYYFSQSACADGLVPCRDDCNFCYLLQGFLNIFQWLMGSLLALAVLLGITIAGMTIIFAGLFPKIVNFAKQTFSKSLKGLLIAFLCWIMINTIMNIAGYKHPQGGKWWQHECARGSSGGGSGSGTNNNGGKCDPKNKILQSVKIQCAEKDFKLEGDGTGFYVVLDTLSEDGSGKTKQLKAVAKYTCDGEISEEDVTAQAEWKASDETQIKVSKGVVAAVAESLGSSENIPYVEAKYQDKNSNQAKVYINACPNTAASIETDDKFTLQLDNLLIPEAHAEPDPEKMNENETDNSNCESCGQTETCPFIYGNENAKYKFILIRAGSECSSENPCHDSKDYWSHEYEAKEKTEEFIEGVRNYFSAGIDYAPSGSKNFGVWASKKIADFDKNCPSDGSLVNYGFFCNGKGKGAHAKIARKKSFYCIDEIKDSRTFAHEQIGHIFADLDDEYTDLKNEPLPPYETNKGWINRHYNCTADTSCSKWQEYTNECYKGCAYSNSYRRSSENSIMNDTQASNSFDHLNEAVIYEKYDKYPDGMENLIEHFGPYSPP